MKNPLVCLTLQVLLCVLRGGVRRPLHPRLSRAVGEGRRVPRRQPCSAGRHPGRGSGGAQPPPQLPRPHDAGVFWFFEESSVSLNAQQLWSSVALTANCVAGLQALALRRMFTHSTGICAGFRSVLFLGGVGGGAAVLLLPQSVDCYANSLS